MTCTPFMSSIVSPGCAARSWSYSFRGIGSRLHGCTDARIGFLCPAGVPAAVRSLALTDVLSRVEADAGKALEILKEYVRFPTISAHKRAQPETAAFVRRLLVENGFEAREYPTDGGPNVVFGQMIVDERKPTLLMYQHYDVQPVDPLNEWKRDPFDPTIEDGKFWGRGCADTKGNFIMQLLAVQAWQGVEGRPPINLKFVVEGEEEVGSPHFGSFVRANQEILHADGATIEGGDHLHEGTPKIELGCKGILYVEMTSRTAKVDQHSSYAAIAPNPAWRLIHALMTLRDAKGRIKVPGWYKDARRPTARELRYLQASAFKADALKEFWGVSEFVGGGDFAERSGRQSRDQGIGRRLRTRAGSVAVVGRRLGPRILQRGRRRALDLGARRLLRRVELPRAERTLPHGGFRWRREAHGRDDGSSLKLISSDPKRNSGRTRVES